MGTCYKITQNDQSVCIAVNLVFSSGQTKMPCWAKPLTFFFGLCGTAYLYMLKQIRGAAVQLWPIHAGVVRLKICSSKSQPLFSQNIWLFLWLWGPRRIYNQPSLHSDPREKKKKQEFGERERERPPMQMFSRHGTCWMPRGTCWIADVFFHLLKYKWATHIGFYKTGCINITCVKEITSDTVYENFEDDMRWCDFSQAVFTATKWHAHVERWHEVAWRFSCPVYDTAVWIKLAGRRLRCFPNFPQHFQIYSALSRLLILSLSLGDPTSLSTQEALSPVLGRGEDTAGPHQHGDTGSPLWWPAACLE